MDKKLIKVIKGYSELDYSEREKIKEIIRQFDNSGLSQRETFIKGLSASLGPLDSSSCPCCGK